MPQAIFYMLVDFLDDCIKMERFKHTFKYKVRLYFMMQPKISKYSTRKKKKKKKKIIFDQNSVNLQK